MDGCRTQLPGTKEPPQIQLMNSAGFRRYPARSSRDTENMTLLENVCKALVSNSGDVMKTRGKTISRRVAWLMVLCAAGSMSAVSQQPQDEETTRHLWDTEFINKGSKPAAARRSARRNYRIVTPTGTRCGCVGRHGHWRHALAVASIPAS